MVAAGLLGLGTWLALPAAHAAETKVHATMDGAQENPAGDPDGKGTADITLDDAANKVCYVFHYEGIGKPTVAHIHAGVKGVSGPPAVDLQYAKNGDQGCVSADPTTIGQIRDNPANYYVNIHTEEYPKGAIRGQLEKA